MSTFLKARAIPPSNRGSLGQSMRRGREISQRPQFKNVEGQFNSFFPKKDKSTWFALCPTQAWNSSVYDKNLGEVRDLKDEYYFVYKNHRVAATKRNFVCSAGAHNDKPCWGCGVRNKFYDDKRAKKDATGIEEKGEAPISGMVQYCFAGVIVEPIAKVRLMDNNGRPKTTKDGKPIFRETPLAHLEPADQARLKGEGSTTFGLPVHYSVGISHYNMIEQFDEEMMNRCANCAGHLTCSLLGCPECGTQHDIANEDGEPLSGQDLLETRKADYQCECSYFGPLVPVVECKCGDPVEGRLVDFALKLKSEKTSETSTILKYSKIKPIKKLLEEHPEIEPMLMNPLKVDEIFAPTNIAMQVKLVPDHLRGDGVSPSPKKNSGGPQAVPYALGQGGGAAAQKPEDDEDEDD